MAELVDVLYRGSIHLCLILILIFEVSPVWSQVTGAEESDNANDIDTVELSGSQTKASETNISTNEDPEARRRAERASEPFFETSRFKFDYYGSVRLHAINNFDAVSGESEQSLGDGASRAGVTGEWLLSKNWNLFGRLESGFDILDTFTTKAQNDNGGFLTPRLYYLGIESDSLYLKYGKSWSAYYQVAGAADRFSIFGGNAAGVYNAGTDGGATGTGRADNALQTRLYMDISKWTAFKPFNVNLQFQRGEPIPRVDNETYGSTYSLSAWLETEREFGFGIAWHRAAIDGVGEPAYEEVGISGDAEALAVTLKTYGDRWLASLVLSRLENIETTDQFKYFDGVGAELFAQWEFKNHWWVTGGGNYLNPDNDDPDAGEYIIRYLVLGLRYTFDSFNRMAYAEWRIDNGKLADGSSNGNEFTVGVRWDFGY